jgi:MFS family permease
MPHNSAMNDTGATPWRAWAVWAVGALFFFYAFMQRTAPSVMVSELMRDFSVNASALGGLSAFYYYAYMAVQRPTGLMADRFGPRRLLTGAALVSAMGGLIFAGADDLALAATGRVLVGIGAGFGFVCTLRMITDWFPPERLAMLTGATMMLGMLGGVTGQAPLAIVVGEVGWRPTMAGVAAVGVVIALGAWLITKDQRGAQGIQHQGSTVWAGLGVVLGNPQTWIIAGYGFSIVVIMFAFGALWGVPYLQQVHGMTRPDAAFAASLILLGWGLFTPLVGWLSDRWRRRKPALILGAIGCLATIAPVLYATELSGAAIKVLLFLNGVAMAGMVVCFPAVREHNHAAQAGTAMAFVNMAVIGSGAVMQPVTGWLLDLGWQGGLDAGVRVYPAEAYVSAFVVLPVACMVALVLGILVRETHARAQS